MLGKNKLKELLEIGKLAVGTCIDTCSPALVELAGFCGLDFCRIDNEHSWRRDESAENMIRAASVSGVTMLLRVDRDDPNVVRKALEIGAGGILVPHINTPEEVEEIVKASKFPPRGNRGIGTLCFSARWGTVKSTDWIKWSNEEQLIGIMIEDYRAISQLDEIMSIKELDYVLFGPSDYSVSIGLPGETSHPKVMEALKKTIEAAERHGKYVSMGVGYPWVENAKKFVDMGCHMVELGHELSILKSIWSMKGEELRKLRK